MRPRHRHDRPERRGPPDASDYIYGRWPVREALEAGPVSKIFVAHGASGGPIEEIVALARRKNVVYHFVDRRKLDGLVGANHQGVVALAAPVSTVELDAVLATARNAKATGPSLLFLDGVMDPQNLGSLLRSAVFFGIPAVVIPKWRAAGLTPAVMRSSAGAARLIPVAQVSNLATAIEQTKKAGFWMVGADLNGEDVKKADLPRPFALVLGSEGEGLHQLVRSKCDVVVTIQRGGGGPGVGSLNVGVAGAILLHQFS